MVLKETFRQMHSCGIIAATATEAIRLSDADLRAHGPLNVLVVWNDSGENIKVVFNNETDTDYILVKTLGFAMVNLDDGKGYYSLDIINEDTVNATAAGEIRLRMARIKDVPGSV